MSTDLSVSSKCCTYMYLRWILLFTAVLTRFLFFPACFFVDLHCLIINLVWFDLWLNNSPYTCSTKKTFISFALSWTCFYCIELFCARQYCWVRALVQSQNRSFLTQCVWSYRSRSYPRQFSCVSAAGSWWQGWLSYTESTCLQQCLIGTLVTRLGAHDRLQSKVTPQCIHVTQKQQRMNAVHLCVKTLCNKVSAAPVADAVSPRRHQYVEHCPNWPNSDASAQDRQHYCAAGPVRPVPDKYALYRR